ncbi:MAG: hypothetical protein P8Q37_01575 [Porticoccaceae bacterium]|nr:hypothetical protein [Porticoccaceae bacterium]
MNNVSAFPITLIGITVLFVGCQNIPKKDLQSGIENRTQHNFKTHSETTRKVIQKGMTASQVTNQLGKPNILKKDRNNNDTWIYNDSVAEQIYQTPSGALGYFSNPKQGSLLSEKPAHQLRNYSLTAIITFDEKLNVDAIKYHRGIF